MVTTKKYIDSELGSRRYLVGNQLIFIGYHLIKMNNFLVTIQY